MVSVVQATASARATKTKLKLTSRKQVSGAYRRLPPPMGIFSSLQLPVPPQHAERYRFCAEPASQARSSSSKSGVNNLWCGQYLPPRSPHKGHLLTYFLSFFSVLSRPLYPR